MTLDFVSLKLISVLKNINPYYYVMKWVVPSGAGVLKNTAGVVVIYLTIRFIRNRHQKVIKHAYVGCMSDIKLQSFIFYIFRGL